MNIIKFKWPVIGHKNIQKYLQESIKRNKLVHAYLFVGPNGVGKTAMANYFVQSVLCMSDKDSSNFETSVIPCGECEHCSQFNKNIHPDVFIVDKEEENKDITINQIRELIEKLSLKALVSSYKIALLKEVNYLNEEAANALLKVLEEPSGKTILVLTADNLEGLPETVISRCQLIRFYPVASEEIEKYINENSKLSKQESISIARFAGGMPGVMHLWLDNKAIREEYLDNIKIKVQKLKDPLYKNLNTAKDIFVKAKLFNEKIKIIDKEIDDWISIFRDLLMIKLDNHKQIIFNNLSSEFRIIAHHYDVKNLQSILTWLLKSKLSLKNNPNPQLLLENFYIKVNS